MNLRLLVLGWVILGKAALARYAALPVPVVIGSPSPVPAVTDGPSPVPQLATHFPDDVLPFDCVANASAGEVELTIWSPGCFAPDHDQLVFGWHGTEAWVRRSRFASAPAVTLPRAAMVKLLSAVAMTSLRIHHDWESCHRPWGMIQVEAVWTCIDAQGKPLHGYATVEDLLCTKSDRTSIHQRGERTQALIREFRERWLQPPSTSPLP